MTDLATLGLEVQSSQVEQGARALDSLSGAAARAEAAGRGVTTSMRGAAAAADGQTISAAAMAKALQDTGGNLSKITPQMLGMAEAERVATAATAGLADASKVARGELVAMGAAQVEAAKLSAGATREFMVLGSEVLRGNFSRIPGSLLVMNERLAATGTSALNFGNVMRILGSLGSVVFNPFIIGIIALTSALSFALHHAKDFIISMQLIPAALNAAADVVQKYGAYVVEAAGVMALLYAPSILAGITAVSEAILGLTARLAGMAIGATEAWLAALGPIGWVIGGIALVSAAVYVFRDQIKSAIGVDVVSVVKDSVNITIGAFIGAFDGIKDVWGQLPAVLGDLVYQAADGVISGIQSMVQKAVDGLNNLMNKYALWRAGIGKPLDPSTYNSLIIGPVEFGRPTNPHAGAAANAVDTINADSAAAMGKNYLGQLGTGVNNMVSGAVNALHSLAKDAMNLGKDDDPAKKKTGKTEAERMAERYDKVTQSGQNFIAMQEAQQKALGMTDLQAAQLTNTQELLNRARQRGIDLTPDQVAQLTNLGNAMGAAEIATKNLKEAYNFVRDSAKGFLSSFTSAIEQGKSLWQAFGDAAKSVLDKIINQIENQLATSIAKLFANQVSNSGGSGLFGWLGSLFGIGGGGGASVDPWAGLRVASANGNVFSGPGIAAYSSSIVSSPTLFKFASGTGLMGEAGPEGILPLRRNSRGQLGVIAANENGGGNVLHFAPVTNIDARGSTMSEGEFRAIIRQEQDKMVEKLPRKMNEWKNSNYLPAFS